MPDQDNGFKLRNCGGVPVIELTGELNATALKRLEKAMRSLAAAGHYNLVVDLKKAAIANLRILGSLKKTIAHIRSHYGAVDLVAEAGQVRDLLKIEHLAGLFRINKSEAQAIRKIKRLLRLPDDSEACSSAHITE
ncbi:MAG: STAS domain-containing protein [Armatimonadota bacterium]|nr:STAS domain-containing protein [Armatimonadota bacterium]